MNVKGPTTQLSGEVQLPGDKSISHRALLHAALSPEESRLRNILRAGVTTSMINCLRELGVEIIEANDDVIVRGGKWIQPNKPLNCGNSATTMRLLMGALAGQPITAELTGTKGLQSRPMGRVARPLRNMGASISSDNAPLVISGGNLHGIVHHQAVASAQVKAALLLAALQATGESTIHQPGPSRDHSERMLRDLGVKLQTEKHKVTIQPSDKSLAATKISVPGDCSSAAFLIASAVLVPESKLTLRDVGINPTRTGIIDVLTNMGADISIIANSKSGGEPIADIIVKHTNLKSVTIEGETVVRMIDEFPIFTIIATQSEGITVVKDAAELRIKESDRISSLLGELRKMGVEFIEHTDGYTIVGPQVLNPAQLESHGDHRMAMSLAIAGMIAQGCTKIMNSEVIDESFPEFTKIFSQLGANIARK
ncbi:MAG: 3-phosphoshikimate 1-carboxyvinyltransferase [Chloroflexi bacterium]|nr:3-phosphoshikimate 1-carboxyvinyltransferase [Chloroflexota bacterium]MBS60114.1 3-phosphoshikimate 1-carboxyvinyltransferase [Anaerolineaceae bacterium]|tara:strand:+ start:22125 stop:23402 length:1278 start_codon:yes stop_codon:yes gene_type:complete